MQWNEHKQTEGEQTIRPRRNNSWARPARSGPDRANSGSTEGAPVAGGFQIMRAADTRPYTIFRPLRELVYIESFDTYY